ncbi:hypothetical protein B0H17DRAFT_1332351 [Mycena rosella]|uniref:Uncharacterized protein n=1 Tax=Mycena rosella TaxID=1033263 RepID=A0AAD7DBG9_MYCRO|nr:hypothetical protein B0H17DRAFT_1332351 [Mycena rosella]
MDPRFPPELEREIFEHAALLYPKTIPGLLLVARRVFHWIHPFLYRTIMIKTGSPSLSAFMRATRSMPDSSSFFRSSIQNLFVHPCPWLASDVRLILESCTGITNFAMMSTDPSVLPLLENKRLQRMSISLAQLFGNGAILGNLMHPVFAHTTHLTLFDYLYNQKTWSTFAFLPALTHLCLFSFVQRAQLRTVLAKCKRLQVLVNIHINTEPEWGLADLCAGLALGDDPRLVLLPFDSSVHAYGRDWDAGLRGEKDFWVVAEAFIRKKRRGEIKPASRCWICEHDGIY